jgi:hypothetical protein
MSSTKNKLRLAAAFAALATLALAVSCTGFFQNPTVSSITIDPPNPTVAFGPNAATQQMTAAASGSITATTTATAAETVTSMTITPITGGITANGTDAATFTINGTTQSGSQNISALVTLTPESQIGTVATDGVVSCIASTDASGADQSCTASSNLTATTTYFLVVTYSGYTGTTTVYATLTVTPE